MDTKSCSEHREFDESCFDCIRVKVGASVNESLAEGTGDAGRIT